MLFRSIAKSLLCTYGTGLHQTFILCVSYWLKVLKKHNNNVHTVVRFKGNTHVPHKAMGGNNHFILIGQPVWHDSFCPALASADRLEDLVRFGAHYLNQLRRGGGDGAKAEAKQERWDLAWSVVSSEADDSGWGKNAWKQEGEIENLPQEDRREGRNQDQALHEGEVREWKSLADPLSAGVHQQDANG